MFFTSSEEVLCNHRNLFTVVGNDGQVCFDLWFGTGWTDDYFEKAQFVNSDTQLYKQAGNGVTVNVIKAIAKRMEIEADDRSERWFYGRFDKQTGGD